MHGENLLRVIDPAVPHSLLNRHLPAFQVFMVRRPSLPSIMSSVHISPVLIINTPTLQHSYCIAYPTSTKERSRRLSHRQFQVHEQQGYERIDQRSANPVSAPLPLRTLQWPEVKISNPVQYPMSPRWHNAGRANMNHRHMQTTACHTPSFPAKPSL